MLNLHTRAGLQHDQVLAERRQKAGCKKFLESQGRKFNVSREVSHII
jgi:hypothetical protein